MHEYAIAYDIVQTARHVAKENNAARILVVHVEIGELSMVNPEQVEFLFHALVEEDPLFSGVRLACNIISPETTCTCGYSGSEIYICPECGALPTIERGREILVTNIEIEAD